MPEDPPPEPPFSPVRGVQAAAGRRAPAAGNADLARLIVAIAQSKDRAAFTRLFGHFAPRVKTYMLRLGAAPALAEDLAQETLLMVWRKAALFDPAGASASGWVYTIARNLRRDRLRRDNHPAETQPELALQPEAMTPPDVALDAADLEQRVRQAMARLGDDQRRVVRLSFFEDRPHAEIAAALGIPLGTVKSRLRLAMKKLRDLLDDTQ
ncbi:MAG: sigma-70 family RNA polymerase sigma factor [Hyphomicrobiaceae bacterium]|nr:sigma-70 family RNA polymerase sigma factor [Hyphomicrobiaceae bacterium]